jgi:hypothetical protein
MLTKAKQADAAKDRLFGDMRGDELPTQLRDRTRRLERFGQAKQQLEDEAAEDTPGGNDARPTVNRPPQPARTLSGDRVNTLTPNRSPKDGGLIPPILTRGCSNAPAGTCRAIPRRLWLPATGSSLPVQ